MPGMLLFAAGVAVSLAASWLLVSRLERLGERAGFSEAWLGLVAALAADAPEITSAVTALARGQASVGAGVVIGSNVFNLAALLGLAALAAGRIAFHRRVVLLGGVPGVWVAAATLLTVTAVAPAAGLTLTAAAGALIAVVGASTIMEVTATALGRRYAVADIVTGGLVLAVVTSLPNAVTAVYLARRGRAAAVLSTALNSNAINVVAGLLVPASVAGLGPRSGQGTLVAAWYAGLTVLALALAYRGRGLGRVPGAAIIAGYLAFVTALVISVAQGGVRPATAILPAVPVAVVGALLLIWPARERGTRSRDTRLLPDNDQAVLLAEALQVAGGHVLDPVERFGVLGVGPQDQGVGLDRQRRDAAESPLEHRARRLLDDLDLVPEMAGELLAVALAAIRRDPRRSGDRHLLKLCRS